MSSLGFHDVRSQVMAMYPNSENWHAKVMRMPNNQVYAIYRSYQDRLASAHQKQDVEEEHWPFFHQIDIFEWMNEKERSKNG